ncbi:efflux RND transporter permease subunit [Sphingosinicella rhizophila]|uniref:Efflux RND transporter permease subunit n=1 Tax=Sphingosinicella rhizophila TaxID=3050082 RepID=A0ABU3Q3X6_9SPHN|nr:efflux RND transporter permease subunit [Sphingosinicella sp. GR2756]MDT9598115.1 efflux RND transporter permease subunit [Sphingosinicella sp. GR2756]
MGFRNISAWSIRNPVPPIVIFIALALAGIVSFMRMEIQNQPDVDFPAVIVSISQPGAAPTELETQVAQRVEAAVRSIAGVDEIQSTVSEGNSQTFVQLDIGTPIDRSVNDIRDAIQQIRSNLPEGILEPQVFRIEANDQELASFSVAATDMTLEQLSWYVDNNIAKELLSVPGMAAVDRAGGVSREIRVILDPVKLQAHGLTAGQVNQQLRAVNLNAAGGRAEIAGSEQSVRVLGNAASAYDLGQTEIATGSGRTIKLADIAEVRDLYAEQRGYATQNGQQVLSFSIKRAKGKSDVSVYDGAIEKINALEERTPGVKITELNNYVKYTKENYQAAMAAMVEGAALAVIVVFLFLRDWRATLISALAIPLSAIPAFWFMSLLGFSLNMMTLLALSLVAGVLVDDAIVEIENIVRHMRMGKSAYQASIDAADEIGLAVLATTMAIVAVFLPVGLMPGFAGQFFKNFGLTVVVAVLMSLAVARMITPMIAAYFLKSKGHASHGEGRLMNGYMSVLRWTMRHRWVAIVGGIAAFVLTIVTFSMLPQTFQPTEDSDHSRVIVEMVPGTNLEQTGAAVREVEAILRETPEVASIFSRVDVGSARVTATFDEQRERTSVEIERAVAPRLARIPDARANFQSQFGGGRDITVTLGGDDPVKLQETANQLVQEMATIPELVAARVDGDLQRPEITIQPRLDLAANLGVTTSALSQAIRIATLGDIDQNSARFSLSDRQIPIRVALEEDARQRLSTIENMPVPTTFGGSVPLKVVATIGFGTGPTKIERINQMRMVNIGGDLAPNIVSSEAWAKIDQLPIMRNLPLGVHRVETGESKWQGEMIQSFIIAVASGILLVFAVLVLLYKRFMSPLVNMGSLLLAPLGGTLALIATGHPISMPVYIGILMLLGIVAKNSILLVDFAIEEMDKGVDKLTAIVDAGHKRAQPIVMTTVAMAAGMVPTALSLNGDGSWRAPMAIMVIGGLIMSTVLTLVIIPASFSLALGIERRAGRRLSRIITYRGVQDHGPEPATQPAE